jgi:hypothetical protein
MPADALLKHDTPDRPIDISVFFHRNDRIDRSIEGALKGLKGLKGRRKTAPKKKVRPKNNTDSAMIT